MKLYFAPLACSMASRIAVYEAQAPVEFVYVDIHTSPGTRLLIDGSDYRAINPMGQVPALRTTDDQLLTENPVVLQYIADQFPQARLAPAAGMPRYRVQEWLNFIATELHKGTFIPLLTRGSPEGARSFAREKLQLRFGHLNNALAQGEFLLDGFSVADCYLVTVLNWSPYAEVDLSAWPEVARYFQHMAQRPSVGRALVLEKELFAEQLQRGPITPRASNPQPVSV